MLQVFVCEVEYHTIFVESDVNQEHVKDRVNFMKCSRLNECDFNGVPTNLIAKNFSRAISEFPDILILSLTSLFFYKLFSNI